MRICIGASQSARVSIGASQVGEAMTLTVNVTGNGSVTLDPAGGTYEAGTTVELTAVADPGWTFDHWEDDLAGSDNPDTILMDGDKTVTAVFTENPTTSNGAAMMLGCHF